MIELICSGASKRYPIPRNVAEKLILRLFQLEAAYNFNDIGLSLDSKFYYSDNLNGRYLMNVLDDYDLVLEVEWLNEGKTQARINVIDLTSSKGK